MHPTLAIAAKDILLLSRDRPAMFFTVLFPVVFAAVFGMIYSGMGGETSAVRVAVVDRARSTASLAVIDRLDGQETLELIPAADADEARDLVRRGRRSACLVIPEDFADLPGRLLTGEPATLELGIDPARTQERAMIEGLVAQAAFEQLAGSFQDGPSLRAFAASARQTLEDRPELNLFHRSAATTLLLDLDRLANQLDASAAEAGAGAAPGGPVAAEPGAPAGFSPIEIQTTQITGRTSDWHASAFSITFAQGVVWALIGCAAAFSMSLVIERSGGTLLRLRAAPLSALHVVAGKGVACVATILVATTLLVILGMGVFGLRIGNPLMLAAAVLSAALAFVGIMMVLAVLGKSPRAAGPLGYAILLTMAILGGGMMPHFMMPSWMQRVGMVSPVKWTVVAVENAVFRGASWGEQSVPLLVLLGIAAAGIAIGAVLFSRARE